MQPLFHLCISKGRFKSDLNPTLISIHESTPAAIMASKAGIKMRLISDWIHVTCKETHESCLLSLVLWFVFFLLFTHQWVWPQSFIPSSHETVSSWDHGTCFCWFTLHGAALVSYIHHSYEGNFALVSRGTDVKPQKQLLMWKWEQLWSNSVLQTGIKRAEKCKYWPNQTG